MSQPTFTPIPLSEAPRLATHALLSPGPQGLSIETAQVQHRLEILNSFAIPLGSRVLEVGCGQGTCTTLLAEFVGPSGHVDAFDPASPDYGAPFTLREAQEHISKGPMGERITWYNREVGEYLSENEEQTWDYIVLCHSLWYFENPESVSSLLKSLASRGTLLVAEYALQASLPSAQPHLLAALTRSFVESLKKTSDENIRSLLSPRELTTLVKDQGWTLSSERILVPGEGLLDGSWEVGSIKSTSFVDEVHEHVSDSRQRQVVLGSRDAMMSSLARMKEGEKVRTMDVWAARFEMTKK